jgi:hypothetical protein
VWGYKCINLIVDGYPGEPGATRCGLYAFRYDGMPIKLVSNTGRIVGESKCALDSPAEVHRTMMEIGRGCSMRVVGAKQRKGGRNAVKANL